MDLQYVADQLAGPYANLRVAAEMFADAQHSRIVFGNRIGSMTVVRAMADYDLALAATTEVEKRTRKIVGKIYKEVVPPAVIEWQQSSLGVGEHLLALLLGHSGHPRLAIPHYWAENETVADDDWTDADNPRRAVFADPPFLRTVGQYWQYCGHGAPARKRKGMTQEDALAMGRPKCKMITHLIAESIVKAGVRKGENEDERVALSPYAQLYLDTKSAYSEKVHNGPCPGGTGNVNGKPTRIRCKVIEDGVKRYAENGDPFQPSHINAIALRRVGKEVLRDLWIAAREDWS